MRLTHYFGEHFPALAQTTFGDLNTWEVARQAIVGPMIDALVNGETWFVDSEMIDVVEAALAQWPGEKLLPTDVPSPCGFVLFERS
jgi:hypothetical protein